MTCALKRYQSMQLPPAESSKASKDKSKPFLTLSTIVIIVENSLVTTSLSL